MAGGLADWHTAASPPAVNESQAYESQTYESQGRRRDYSAASPRRRWACATSRAFTRLESMFDYSAAKGHLLGFSLHPHRQIGGCKAPRGGPSGSPPNPVLRAPCGVRRAADSCGLRPACALRAPCGIRRVARCVLRAAFGVPLLRAALRPAARCVLRAACGLRRTACSVRPAACCVLGAARDALRTAVAGSAARVRAWLAAGWLRWPGCEQLRVRRRLP